jgi:hypothetical protein
MLDPTPEHLAGHNHDACSQTRSGSGSGAEPPVFARKDHLVQHLRLVHRVDTLPLIDEWRIAAPPIVCRCGFCGAALGSWQQRADHLAKHFREGRTMDEWQGDHGFEPAVAAQVTNAIPPYVLGVQRKTPIPFTATGSGTRDQMCQMRQFYRERQASLAGGDDAAAAAAAAAIGHGDSLSTWAAGAASSELLGTPATADGTADDIELNLDAGNPGVEWLALGLARFARFQMRSGVVPTDRMFQDEARRLFYGCEDGWEQTLADNPEWLSGFRMQHIDRRDGQGG